MVSTVRLTRPRHPFEGRQLPVLGRMRRHGEVELLVVLPDGSKRLVPAAWTDLDRPPGAADAGDDVRPVPQVELQPDTPLVVVKHWPFEPGRIWLGLTVCPNAEKAERAMIGGRRYLI